MNHSDVKGITAGLKPEDFPLSKELAERHMNAVKIEMVCRDQDAERIVGLIKTSAITGIKGDGLVIVTPVDRMVHIDTEGEDSQGAF